MKTRAFWTVLDYAERILAKHGRLYWLIVVLGLGCIVVTACAAPSAPTATLAPRSTATLSSTPVPSKMTSPTATLATTTPGGFPVGTYAPDHKLGIDWIRFDADGKWVSALLPADAERAGRYVVDGDKITFLTDVGICQPFQSIYHWKTNGNVLTFVVIDEQCTASSRQADLTGRSWIKQP